MVCGGEGFPGGEDGRGCRGQHCEQIRQFKYHGAGRRGSWFGIYSSDLASRSKSVSKLRSSRNSLEIEGRVRSVR